jgi:hypothetical protein
MFMEELAPNFAAKLHRIGVGPHRAYKGNGTLILGCTSACRKHIPAELVVLPLVIRRLVTYCMYRTYKGQLSPCLSSISRKRLMQHFLVKYHTRIISFTAVGWDTLEGIVHCFFWSPSFCGAVICSCLRAGFRPVYI